MALENVFSVDSIVGSFSVPFSYSLTIFLVQKVKQTNYQQKNWRNNSDGFTLTSRVYEFIYLFLS